MLPLANIAEDDRSFIADPFEQFCALRRLKAENLELLAIYHSHPGGGVDPSREDLAYATQWPCIHLIIAASTLTTSDARFRGFRYEQSGLFTEVPVQFLSG